jgi:conjugative relaxase-like TrwC/TraI family protein
MLSMDMGHDPRYLTDAVGGGREGYYTDASVVGEPAGRWWGEGAEALGLNGEVNAEVMHAMYTHLLDPRDPAARSQTTWGDAATLGNAHANYRTPEEIYGESLSKEPHAGPERREELRAAAEVAARQAVPFIDLTFSPTKSVTVLNVAYERAAAEAAAVGDMERAAEFERRHQLVEAAVMAGASASLAYLADVAGYSRANHHGGGAGQWVDGHGWVAAQFLQHDSRDHDPQLHVHQAVLNRALGDDGKWRALDSWAIRNHRAAAGVFGERVTEARLAQDLGLPFVTRADGRGREIAGIPAALAQEFSSRAKAIGPAYQELAQTFRERFGREPSAADRTRLRQQATLETRKGKTYGGETSEARMDRWEAQARESIGAGLADVAERFSGPVGQAPVQKWSETDVIERALATVGDSRATWSRADLMRAVGEALPANLGLPAEDTRELLDGLTAAAISRAIPVGQLPSTAGMPKSLLLADGRSSYENPSGQRYTTEGQIAAERILRGAAVERGAFRTTNDVAAAAVARYAESKCALHPDQAAALAGVMTSGAWLETLSAAPGTGKSFAVGAINSAWEDLGRRVHGLATTEVATGVLREEGLTARNISQWLACQDRLANGRGIEGDEQYAVASGDVVVVDEASMTSTADLLAVQQQCRSLGAKLLLVGDEQQLAPVGPGGAFADAAAHGVRYELTGVRRFEEDWEKAASLGLRAGDPAAIAEYAKHGRLIDAGTADQAEAKASDAWLADTLAGKESLLVAATNEQATRMSASMRDRLISLGKVSADGVELRAEGTTAGVGDVVQARRNAWNLLGWEGNAVAPVNRQAYTVTGLREDGGVTVENTRTGDSLELPKPYVDEHLRLGYASTVHAAEGRTVKTCHPVLGPGMDAASALVALTRGTESNTAWAVTRKTGAEAEPGEANSVEPRTAQAVLQDLVNRRETETTAMTQMTQAAIDANSTLSHGDKLIDGLNRVLGERTANTLDFLEATGDLSEVMRQRLAADPALESLTGLLRSVELSGGDPDATLAAAIGERELDSAISPGQVLYDRIVKSEGRPSPSVGSFAELIPEHVPADWRPWLERCAADADARRPELGSELGADPPQWAVEQLGAVPEDAVERLEWEDRAAVAASWRELSAQTDPVDALGPAPSATWAPERYALWRAGADALGLTNVGPAEQDMTAGQLRARVAAWEREENWAPGYVAPELSAVSEAEAEARRAAVTLAAEADAEADPERASMLRGEAEQAHADAQRYVEQVAQLDESDTTRAEWFAHTAPTREKAHAARDELGIRGIDLRAEPTTTGREWVEAHREEQAADEVSRPVRDESELSDAETEQLRAEVDELTPADDGPVVETAVPDIRETSEPDAREHSDEGRGRIPSPAESTASVDRAHDAVMEMQARDELDARNEEDRVAQLAAESAQYEAERVEADTAWQQEPVS